MLKSLNLINPLYSKALANLSKASIVKYQRAQPSPKEIAVAAQLCEYASMGDLKKLEDAKKKG